MDRDLKVSYGDSRESLHWSNSTTTFAELCERLKTTKRTSETTAEYSGLSREMRDKIKDKGGLVGGHLKDGRRKVANVLCRSMGTMDVDSPEEGFVEKYRKEHRFASVLYSTHSHTPEAPRYRIIFPFTEDVPPEKYEAIMRWFAFEIGIEGVDPCSYRVNQLMHFPTTPSDGEYIYEVFDGDWLDPDAFLVEYPGWEDVSTLPVSSKEDKLVKRSARHQQDPLTKGGVIGAFNNAFYPIQKLLEEQLADVYEPTTDEKRYTHIGSTGTAGAVIYEDKFLYSHHATDPAYGKLLSAFDLMRVHRFGTDDESLYKALKFAAGLEEVKALLDLGSEYDLNADLRPVNHTDVDEARVFAEQYRHCVRHSTATEYIVYDGCVWVESEARAHGMLHELTDRQLLEHEEDYSTAKGNLAAAEDALSRIKIALADKDDGVSKGKKLEAEHAFKEADRKFKAEDAYHQFLLKCRNSGKIAGILEEAKTLLEIDVADLDADPFLLNTPGGEVDLRTGELLPHDPEHFHTRITNVAPSDEGMAIWLDFLKLITCGDKELEEYLQITSGEELVGRIYNENMRIKVGQGSNGKSTYTNSKLRVIGSYGGQISAETLTTGNKSGKNWEIAELRGKRLIVASELEEGMRLNTAFVKKICSTDPILGEKKHKDPFTFLPSHTVVLYTNHLPKVGSIDKGTWRRLTVIPFNATITGDSDIKNYTDYLYEHCGGAILKWMIEGARRFIDAQFHIRVPNCVSSAVENYHSENDWVSAFLEECCEQGDAYAIKAGELYQFYRSYCESIGEFKRSPQEFKAAIISFGFKWHKYKTGAVYGGLRLKDTEAEDDFLN